MLSILIVGVSAVAAAGAMIYSHLKETHAFVSLVKGTHPDVKITKHSQLVHTIVERRKSK